MLTAQNLKKIMLVSGFLLIVILAGASYYTSKPKVCASCHLMEPIYQRWTQSAHKDVECYACHAEPGFAGAVQAKISGVRELMITLLNLEARPQATVKNERCQSCHQQWPAELKNMPGIIYNHEKHSRGYNCTLCHSGVAHGSRVRLKMKDCLACHRVKGAGNAPVDDCLKCHRDPNSLKPRNHQEPAWAITHGREYRRDKNNCLACHRPATNLCQQCHPAPK